MTPDVDKRRVTMETLANDLGVSKSTISLALRDSPRVKEETRLRVKELAEQVGYQRDPILSAYAQRRRRGELCSYRATIGVIWPEHHADELWPTTTAQAQDMGYGIDNFYLCDYPSQERLVKVLHARGIAALLVPDHHHQSAMLQFPWEDFIAVQCGVGRFELPVPIVRYDSFATMRLAWVKMREAGARRIGVILARNASSISMLDEKTASSFYYMQSQAATSDEEHIPPLAGTIDEVFDQFVPWLRKHRPDGVIGPWKGLYVTEAEYLQPRENFAGFVALRTETDGIVTGCTVHRSEIESIALNYLDTMIGRHRRWRETMHRLSMVLQPTWHLGETLRPLKQ